MTGETWAVRSIHSKAVQLVDGGYEIALGTTIKVGEPIFTADSFDEAEARRLARVEEWKGRVA